MAEKTIQIKEMIKMLKVLINENREYLDGIDHEYKHAQAYGFMESSIKSFLVKLESIEKVEQVKRNENSRRTRLR